ncbi:hypothetical protein J6590_019225 [Homalodisca vitripennis]|nr:hypothetical protein J6590_019225 [Homalodisca vitripennis]
MSGAIVTLPRLEYNSGLPRLTNRLGVGHIRHILLQELLPERQCPATTIMVGVYCSTSSAIHQCFHFSNRNDILLDGKESTSSPEAVSDYQNKSSSFYLIVSAVSGLGVHVIQ